MQLIAVSLIGIPGSGKSTLAHKILEMSREDQLSASVIVICFDDHLKIDYTKIAEGVYKQERNDFIEKIENFMRNLKGNQDTNEVLCANFLKIPENCYNIKPLAPVLVILDDNMYFRSMRQRIRAICRDIGCQHFQIFLDCKLEKAIERNKKRENPVPDDIIRKMYENLEKPTNPRTIFVKSSENLHSNFVSDLNDRICNPEDLEEKECPPKIPQQQSIIHEVDLITRKELTKKIKNHPGADISQFSARLNRRRKEFLEDLKTQKVTFDDVESLRRAFECFLSK